MATRIKPDVLQALADWKAGKPVRSLELGHVHRMKEVPGFSPTIDASKHLDQDQERAHAYCFAIIDQFSRGPLDDLYAEDGHDRYLGICQEMRTQYAAMGGDLAGLTEEEIVGAESLAWKALRFGWARAIEGHKDSMYITVSRGERAPDKDPAAVQAT